MRPHDVFISYSREDRETAMRIAAQLEREGFAVWWDVAIHSGETFDEVIERKLKAAKAAVVLWSPRSVASRWVRSEAAMADRRKIVVPVIIEPCDLPILFELSHTIDLTRWDGDHEDPAWRNLVDDIRFLVDPDAPQATHSPEQDKPVLFAGQHALDHSERPASSAAAVTSHLVADTVEHEPTAFYVADDRASAFGGNEVHCLEIGPEDAPIEKHAISLLGAKVGRAAPADIVFSDKRISRRHCSIEVKGEDLIVSDLHSTNGTFIDGARITEPTLLPHGSELKIGNVVLTHRIRALAEVS